MHPRSLAHSFVTAARSALTLSLACLAGAQEPGWWSLQPLSEPSLPTASPWCQNEVDAFVLRGLSAEGLSPSVEADAWTLVRRLTFDLWGLPPTPEDIEAFLSDGEEGAYERLVDRLLESPRHAERQARHWLDVARYADTHGFDKDKRRPNAWGYRDWVVGAFLDDLPWSEFVRQQVAGDVLDPGGPGVAAAGFLAAGPWDYVGHVELREGTLDKQITRNLDRDEVLRASFEAFTSTTVGCARCHDHKFDPVSTRSYYQLQALLSGFERADGSYDMDTGRRAARRNLTNALADATSDLVRHEAELEARTTPELDSLREEVSSLGRFRLPADLLAETGGALGYHSEIAGARDEEKWVQVDLGEALAVDTISLWPASEVFGDWDGEGFGFPQRFTVSCGMEADLSDGTVLCSLISADLPNPGGAPLIIPGSQLVCRYVRVTAHRLWPRRHGVVDFCFALAELTVDSNGEQVALGCSVTSLDTIEAGGSWGRSLLTDGIVGGSTLEHLRGGDGGLMDSASRHLSQVVGFALEIERIREALTRPEDQALTAGLASRIEGIEADLDALGGPDSVYTAASTFASEGNFTQPDRPRPVHVLTRGEVHSPGPSVEPGVPDLGAHKGFSLQQDAGDEDRRVALADWFVSPDHPLTWRSAANRLWQWRFRQGLVPTPSDFGRMGAPPSHPDLLDWLACKLRSGELTARGVTRLIVTSAAYRQASTDRPSSVEVDASNRFLWRGPRGRVDAESLHDALLLVSGDLDLTMGGPGFDRFIFEDDHSPRYLYGRLEHDRVGLHRRAIYRFVVRSVPDPWLTTFDCPDPSQPAPQRAETITPLQALTLFNSPFGLERAEALALRSGDPGAAWRFAMGRPPTEEEMALLLEHEGERGLESTCRVILNSPGFLYVH